MWRDSFRKAVQLFSMCHMSRGQGFLCLFTLLFPHEGSPCVWYVQLAKQGNGSSNLQASWPAISLKAKFKGPDMVEHEKNV